MTYRKLFNRFNGKVARDENGNVFIEKEMVAFIDGGILRVDANFAKGDALRTRQLNYVAKELNLVKVVGEDVEPEIFPT